MASFVAIPIWGLVLARSIAEYMSVCSLMIYLMFTQENLFKAAIIMNIFDALSSFLPLLLAYVAYANTDPFNVILFSTASYVMGLIMLMGTPCYASQLGLMNVAMLLVALGKSGGASLLYSFLHFQLTQGKKKHQTTIITPPKRRRFDTQIWWHTAWNYGYVVVLMMSFGLFTGDDNLFPLYYYNFQISAMFMSFASLLFFYCNRFYQYDNPKTTLVISPSRLFTLLLKNVSWASLIPYGVVLATANTLFIAQITTNLDLFNETTSSFIPFTPMFFMLKSLARDLVNLIFRWKSRAAAAIRIGAGIACSVAACMAAREVEINRKEEISIISGFWVIPEFLVLGVMEGLVRGHVHDEDENIMVIFGEPLSEIVVCVGKLSNILLMSLCSVWFGESMDESKMERYFLMLAILCLVCFCFYLFSLRNFSGASHFDANNLQTRSTQQGMQNVHDDVD